MNTKEFLEMDYDTRVKKVNELLKKYDDDSLRKVSEFLGLSYSTFCKEMSKGDYVYIKRANQYFKFLREDSPQKQPLDYNKELEFLRNNIEHLAILINGNKNCELRLDSRIYTSDSSLVNKNLKINNAIYIEFINLCEKEFNYLKIQDLISQALVEFTYKYKK
jgi:hypothetical protein